MRTAATAEPYTDDEIAQVVHEAVRGLQYVQNDPSPSDPWQVCDPATRDLVTASVTRARRAAITPSEHHAAWVEARTSQGWRWGPVKNAADKTHPLLVPYEDLDPGQRLKDELSLAIIALMASAL